VFDRNVAGRERLLQFWDVEPEESHSQREEDSWEQVEVLRGLVEGWRVLEDAEAAGAEGHQGEPLHDDEVDEVDTRGLVQAVREKVRVGGEIGHGSAVAEPEVAEEDAVALQIPVGHCEGCNGFQDADKAIRLHHQLPVDEAIDLGFPGLAEQDIGLWGFVRKDDCGSTIREAACTFLATVYRSVDGISLTK
jgi:hypothetical protein